MVYGMIIDVTNHSCNQIMWIRNLVVIIMGGAGGRSERDEGNAPERSDLQRDQRELGG